MTHSDRHMGIQKIDNWDIKGPDFNPDSVTCSTNGEINVNYFK